MTARRRRRANVEGGRTKPVKLKVSPDEHLALTLRADVLGWTVQRLMIESALADRGETATERRELLTTLFTVARYLGAVSNNVNQIARAVNATSDVQEDLAATLAAVRRTADRVDAALWQLGVGR
jgi:hypothetical protein